MNRWQELRKWFMSLEKRERLVFGNGGAILLIVLIYAGIINPYVKHRTALASHVQEQRVLLAWMQPAVAQLKMLGGNQPAPLPGGSLLAAINRAAADAGLGNALQQIQQNNDGSVRVQLQGAPFDSMVRWLGALRQDYGIVTSDMTVARAAAPGLVDSNITLQGPGA